ncbi:Flp family type IVb pilin [Burkholderia contaminans]
MDRAVGGSAGAAREPSSVTRSTNREPETIMQARVRAVCRRIGDEQGVTSIEYAFLAAMFSVAVLGSVVTFKGSLAGTYEVIATAVTAAVATALAMVS